MREKGLRVLFFIFAYLFSIHVYVVYIVEKRYSSNGN